MVKLCEVLTPACATWEDPGPYLIKCVVGIRRNLGNEDSLKDFTLINKVSALDVRRSFTALNRILAKNHNFTLHIVDVYAFIVRGERRNEYGVSPNRGYYFAGEFNAEEIIVLALFSGWNIFELQ